jgi:hypothetical protein
VSLELRNELEFSLEGNPTDFFIELLSATGIPSLEIAHLNSHRVIPLDSDAHISKSFIGQIYALMHQALFREDLARSRKSM